MAVILSPKVWYPVLILNFISGIEGVLRGKIAEPGQFPYQVLLQNEKTEGICSGSIIGKTHILTAWHCVENTEYGDIKIFAGIVNRDDSQGKLYEVGNIRLHEGACNHYYANRCYDIAILTTTKPIEYSQYISPILLPIDEMVEYNECTFSGWGLTEDQQTPSNELRYKMGRTLDPSTCRVWLDEMYDYEFCFDSLENDELTIAEGDSGGPFECDGFLTGVMIRGGNHENDPAVCIDVYQLRSFIDESDDESCHI